ncbi:hypothetical protein Tco_1385154 [Tanacetum coccineum]
MTEPPLMDLGLVVPVFSLGDDPIACLNKAMAFLHAVSFLKGSLNDNQTLELPLIQEKSHYARRQAQEAGQILDEEKVAFLADPRVPDG